MVAQTLFEYGVLNAMAAGFAAARYRIETVIGSGNSEYLLFLILGIIVLLLVKRRRVR